MKTYQLINPVLDGNVRTSFRAANSLEAANLAYTAMSKYFANSVKSFKFSMARVAGDEKISNVPAKHLYHFVVKESRNGKDVEFAIKPFTGNIQNISRLTAKVDKLVGKQSGGKSKWDDDDDSDSDESLFMRKYISEPLRRWYYFPTIYGDPRFFLPTFPFGPDIIIDGINWPYLVPPTNPGLSTTSVIS